ncbi:unnamed protein product [Rotaria socialis]|uniref:Uncharacterized protein n=1 Tax=Rotaria socialis TaxID=392032 RepID=A0A817SR34_9BILA|nr:unnamed protein product [Rotaria socialis]
MSTIRKNRMKRWKQQRLQNQAIQIAQALYQHNVDEVNIDPEIDDIIDINSININNTIDDPIISNVNVSKSRFLNDAMSVARFKQTIADRDEPFFRPLVEELVTLEQSAKFQYQDDNNSSTSARIFLIGACCDKPTQALLQFLPEPIATFGCKRCEVEGFMVRTDKEGNVRSFAMTLGAVEETYLRSSMRFDVLLDLKLLHEQIQQSFPMRKRKSLMEELRLKEKGVLGPCILRELSYFDVRRSFMADTLHNVYIGAFKRLLQLWFDPDYRFQDWSISTHLSELQLIFRGLGLPSMTPRLPCCLISYSKFKANEMRILLLFGHAIFKNILKKDYTFLETRRDDAPV